MDYGRVAKFAVRVILSFALFSIGAAMFFVYDQPEDKEVRLIAVSFMTTVFGAWMSMGSKVLNGNDT